jgi:hypothetical protein
MTAVYQGRRSWATFLEGGGGSVLALAFAVMAVWIGRRTCA